MIFSGTTEYAIRGLAELAGRSSEGQSMLLDQLIVGTGLPRDFMAKVVQRLVKAGILKSLEGRGGGFSLARPAHQITLLQIIESFDGTGCLDHRVVGLEKCSDQMACPQHDLYKPIRQRLKDYLIAPLPVARRIALTETRASRTTYPKDEVSHVGRNNHS